MPDLPIAERHAAVLDRMRAGRQLVADAIQPLTLADASAGSSWSVIDAARHMQDTAFYRTMIGRILDEDDAEFAPRGNPEDFWKLMQQRLLASMDDTIAWVESFTPEQLAKAGHRGDRQLAVIDVLETNAGHYTEHGTQIRDEILPAVRAAQAVGAGTE